MSSTAPVGDGPSSLRRRIGRVASASAVALVFGEVVTLVQTVVLARLLTPTEVGVFAAGTVLTVFLGGFVEGGLRAGLVQRETEVAEAAETVFWATLVAGVLMAGGALLAAPVVGMVFDDGRIAAVAAATSGVLLLFALTNVPESVLQREFSVRRRIVVGPSVSISYAVVAVAGAVAGWGVWSMVAGLYASYVVWVVAVWSLTDWRPRRARASWALWRELARYGGPLVVAMIGTRVYQVLETVVIGRGLDAAALGQFRYAQRIAQIPEKAVVEVGAVALFPAFARLAGDVERLRPAFVRSLGVAVLGAAALSGLMIALGLPAVVVLLGEEWRPAGYVVMAMAGLGLGRALVSVSQEALKGVGRTRSLNWVTAVELVLGVVGLVVLVELAGLVGAGLAISVTAVVVGMTCLGLAASALEVSLRQCLLTVCVPLPAAALATAATWWFDVQVLDIVNQSVLSGLIRLVGATVVFGVVYGSVLIPLLPSARQRLIARMPGRTR